MAIPGIDEGNGHERAHDHRIVRQRSRCCAASEALAAGDEAKGQAYFNNACLHCHAADRAGPPYTDLVGRKAGTVANFNYSAASAQLEHRLVRRDARCLALAVPTRLVPGTFMGVTFATPRIGRTSLRT